MTDPAFYDKLSIVRKQVGDQIPTNILEYFLKESSGDINHCISLIKDNYIKPWEQTTPPEHSVHLLHQTSSRPTHTPPTQPIGMSRHSNDPHSPYNTSRVDHTHSLQPGSSPIYKISPPPYNIRTPHGFEPIPFSPYSSHQNEVDYSSFQDSYNRGSGNDRGLTRYNSPREEGTRRPPESMPVRVPYNRDQHRDGVNYYEPSPPINAPPPMVANSNQRSTNTLSLTELTLQLQREQLQRAKNEHDSLHRVYITAQNEVKERQQRLKNIKHMISQTQSDINEEELYMTECINSSLRYDISKEREKKKLHYTASISSSSSHSLSWQCPHCAWSNSSVISSCEKCPYTKPV